MFGNSENRRDGLFGTAQFGVFGSNTTGAYRRALFSALKGVDPNDQLSDEIAETDRYDKETRSERAHGHDVIDRYMEERGLTKNDPWAAFKLISGDRVGGAWLNQVGRSKPNKPHHGTDPAFDDFSAWADAFDKQVINPYVEATWDEKALAKGLGNYALNTPFYMGGGGAEPIRGGRMSTMLEGGGRFNRHLDAMLGVMGMATESLDIAMFSFEAPTILEALGQTRWAQDNGMAGLKTRVRTSTPFSLQSKQAARLMSFWKSDDRFDYSTSGPITGTPFVMTDHFKAVGANLRSATMAKRAFMIGSANVTQAALGKGVDRYGKRWGDHGSNKESMFVLSHDLVGRGVIRDENVFKFLTDMAAEAMDWAHAGDMDEALNSIDRFVPGTAKAASAAYKSRILGGSGIREMHRQMFASMGATDSAVLTTFNVGDKFLDSLVDTLHKGAKITLYHGARYDFSNGPQMTAETPATHNIQAWKDKMIAEGKGHLLSNIEFIQHTQQLVHAKVGMFTIGGKTHRMYTSMNYDNEQWEGWYDNKKYPGVIRQMGIFLEAGEYGRTFKDGAGVDRDTELEMLKGEIAWGKLFKERPAGYRAMADGGWDRHQMYGVKMIQKVHSSDGVNLNAVKLGVGGLISFGQGRERSSFDFGSFFTLTMGDYDLGPKGSLYAQEMSKFITPAYGITKWTKDSKDGIDKMDGIEEYQPQEVAMAAMGYVQGEFEGWVKAMALDMGAKQMQASLADPVFRAALRMQLRDMVKSRLENFAGLEPGVSAYGAKQYARLGFLQHRIEEGKYKGELRLDMMDPLAIDANSIERNFAGGEKGGDRAYLKLTGKHFFFSAGGLSSFSSRGERTPARFYDMSLFNMLPMAAKLKREGMTQEEYFFMLPSSKLEQLPQRLQNIMSARNLSAVEEHLFDPTDPLGRKTNTKLVDESRFIGQEGEAMKGIRFRGFMVPGMTGDNAYLIGERFQNAYFGDEAWRKEVKVPMRTMFEPSGGMLEAKLQQLIDVGVDIDGQRFKAKRLANNRVFLDANILKSINHQLPVAMHHIGDTNHMRLQTVDLGTGKYEGTGIILDMDALSARQGVGTSTLSLRGTLIRRLTSGDRSILGGKFPYAFVSEQSGAYQASLDAFSGADNDYFRSLNMKSTNVMFGSGTLKTGQAFIETGIEMLSTAGQGKYAGGMMYEAQLRSLFSGSDAESKAKNLTRFAAMYQKFSPYLADDVRTELQPLMMEIERVRNGGTVNIAELESKIRAQLDGTRDYLSKNKAIRMGPGDMRHVAGAALAFGIHALHSIDLLETSGKLPDLYKGFGVADPNMRIHRLNLDQMSAQQMMSMVYMSFVSAPSAAAVAMSSRDRVNFLHYHSGGYTDAFFDMMAMDPRVKRRAQAYQELLVGGLLGHGGMDEVVIPGEFNPMTRFETGHGDEFADVLRISRELQGYGRKGTVDKKRRLALRSQYDAANKKIMDRRDGLLGDDPMSRVLGKNVAGSTESAEIQEFLGIQERAGVKSRTIFMSQLGRNEGGKFMADSSGTQMRKIAVKMISPGALKALGSFEDFAHEMQRLQVAVERKMWVMDYISQDNTGRVVNRMSELQQQEYDDLMRLIGELQAVQGQAAVSDMQKVLGGQLAIGGRNMVIGTLPDIEHGTMVVGDEVWGHMRKGAAAEMLTGIKAVARKTGKPMSVPIHTTSGVFGSKGLDSDAVTTQVIKLIQEIKLTGMGGAHMDDLTRLEASLRKASVDNRADLAEAESKIDTIKASLTAAQATHKTEVRELAGKQRERDRLRKQTSSMTNYTDPAHRLIDLMAISMLDTEIAAINTRMPSLKGDVDLFGRELDNTRQLVRTHRMGYLQAMQETSQLTLERILDNQWARETLMKGLFQRAGAPMGPMGVVVGRLLTASEYNKIARKSGKGLMIDEVLSARSVFLSQGAMAFNLGDFDGDTGSITWFHQFSRLQTVNMLGGALTNPEQQVLKNAQNKLHFSMEETAVDFARYYTGWDHIFNERSLYVGDDYRLAGKTITQARDHLHSLEALAGRIAIQKGVETSQLDLNSLTVAERVSFGLSGMGDLESLKAFRQRKSEMYGLSIAANKYVADLYELHQDIGLFVEENRGKLGGVDKAFDAFMSKKAGGLAFEKIEKSVTALFGSDTSGGMRMDKTGVWMDDRPLTHNALMTFFVMTSFASTTLISKIFEVSYTARTMIDSRRARERHDIYLEAQERYRSFGDLSPGQTITALDTKAKAGDMNAQRLVDRYHGVEEGSARLEGMLLTAQQIAREAIKPKAGGLWDMIDAELQKYKGNPTANDFVVSGKKLAKEGPRYKGLEVFYQIIEGRDFSGDSSKSDVRNWVHDLSAAKAAGLRGVVGLDEAHASVKAMLVDYYGGQVEAMYASGLSRPEMAKRLALEEKDTGIKLFATDADASAALAGALPGSDTLRGSLIRMAGIDENQLRQKTIALFGLDPNKAPTDEQVDKARRVLSGDIGHESEMNATKFQEMYGEAYGKTGKRMYGKSYADLNFDQMEHVRSVQAQKAAIYQSVEQKADQRARDMIYMGIEARGDRSARNNYMNALSSGDAAEFGRATGMLNRQEKMQIIAASAARGKFETDTGLKNALTDLFSEFHSAGEVRAAAETATSSTSFVEQIGRVFEAYKSTGSASRALERVNASTRVGLLQIDEQIVKAKAEKRHADATKLQVRRDNLADNLGELEHMRKTFMGGEETGYMPRNQKFTPDIASIAGRVDKHISKTGGGALGQIFSNVLIPMALTRPASALTGGMAGVGGERAVHSMMDMMAGHAGEMAGMAMAFANPANMLRDAARMHKGQEGAVHTGIVAASFLAGAGAGHWAGQAVARHMTRNQARMGTPGGGVASAVLAASAVGGFAAGSVVAAAATGLAMKFGWLKKHAPMRITSPELHDSGDRYLENEDAMGETNDLADVQDEEVILQSPDGENIATGFYQVSWASRDDMSGFDNEGGMSADLDTYVSQGSYESAGAGSRETAFDRDLDAQGENRA